MAEGESPHQPYCRLKPWYTRTNKNDCLLFEGLIHIFLSFLDRKSTFDFRPYLGDLYKCVFVRLKAADIDQEVKERAISCMYVYSDFSLQYLQFFQESSLWAFFLVTFCFQQTPSLFGRCGNVFFWYRLRKTAGLAGLQNLLPPKLEGFADFARNLEFRGLPLEIIGIP